jgi:hypothetical protein
MSYLARIKLAYSNETENNFVDLTIWENKAANKSRLDITFELTSG